MNKKLTTKLSIFLLALSAAFTSCLDDNKDEISFRPTALVTVIPLTDSFILQLDDSTHLEPVNMTKSPFGDKEVRALVNYDIKEKKTGMQKVHINWMDSIRTKMTVPSLGDKNNATYGNDPIEIVNDWVTIAEAGYLTLRVRTRWGYAGKVHYLNLLTGADPKNPFDLELRHNAQGDLNGNMGDALIAFNLYELMKRTSADTTKFTLRWNSFSGTKKLEFDLKTYPIDSSCDFVEATEFASSAK